MPTAPAKDTASAAGNPATTIVASLRTAVAMAPDRTALVCGAETLTYAEYGRAVDALAARLADAGAQRRTVAIAMSNSPRIAVAVFAIWAAGGRVACLNPAYTTTELEPLLAAAEPVLLLVDAAADAPAAPATTAAVLGVPVMPVGDAELRPEAETRPLPDPDPEDEATLLFTGGTTGRPKGVEHTHRSLLRTVQGSEDCWPTRLGQETWLNVAPMFHIWGFAIGFLHAIHRHGTLVIVPRFTPQAVVAAMELHRTTIFSGGPAAVYGGVLTAVGPDTDLSALRLCQAGGSAVSTDLHDRWQAATGQPIYEAYGMTELAPITHNPPGRPPRCGSVGVPAPGVEVEVVDAAEGRHPLPPGEVGEIRVRAPHLLRHYRGLDGGIVPALTDGWFPTGDVGRFDGDGYLHIVDRKKDMIIVAGFNVYPREIDDTLLAHPAVAEAATVGVPDERRGERPVSFVSAAPGARLDVAELERHCAEHLTAYKLPSRIVVLPRLPRTPANKADRVALRRHPSLAAGPATPRRSPETAV